MINVKGILTDAEGVPLPQAIIEFYSTRNAGESLNGAAAVTRTDEHGGYDFILKSGEYELYAQVAKSTDVYFVGECTVTRTMTGAYDLEALMSMAVPLLPESVTQAIDAADTAVEARGQVHALHSSVEQYAGSAKVYRDESAAHAKAAAMSAQAGSESESKAKASEEAAALHEQASEDNAIASGNAASEASQSELMAASHAHKALEHKNAAGVSEGNAKNSELAAKASEQGALSHKNAASLSENNAQSEAEASAQNALVATEQAGIATEQADLAASRANAAATSAGDANSAAKRAESSAAAMTGALLEMGAVNLSSGVAPAPYEDEEGTKRACFWKVVVPGVIDGVNYGVGDSIVYSAELDTYYKIDNTESVTSVNGKKGVVTLSALDIGALPAGSNAVSASKWATPRVITIDGDAQGSVTIDGSANVSLSLSIRDATHAHAISNITGLRAELDGKSETGHSHTASEIGARPDTWVPSFNQVTGKPTSYPTNWSMIGSKPETATRWPSLTEIGALGKTEVADSVKPATATKCGGVKIEFDGTTLNIVTG
ncbi:hypothetical protein [Salinivibrio sp. VYel1]|uniref:hypothetical protein n=1 Tax=Salinivibrio sp. VYel1 TaxID=2490490 RepID=UPI00128C20F2|nr:hypothetical protein [Salinivibrio sp. VYel1]MPX91434.1 hypothetical protein [Salinivibrio sp. VYel1]